MWHRISISPIFFLFIKFFEQAAANISEKCFFHIETPSSINSTFVCTVQCINDNEAMHVVFCSNIYNIEVCLQIPNTTIELNIYNVRHFLTGAPLCAHLHHLETLHLLDNKIVVLNKQMFYGFEELRLLSLRQNLIRSLPEDVFDYCRSLEVLDLSRNFIFQLGNITRAMKSLTFLTELDLSENAALDAVKSLDLTPLNSTNLKILRFNGCQIRQIDRDLFISVRNITVLDISENPFNQTALLNLTQALNTSGILENLKELRLKNLPEVRFFPFRFFQSLEWSKIKSLELAGNRFLDLPFLYLNYPMLEKLDLSSSRINIDGRQFNMSNVMPRLKTLVLREVEATEINEQFMFLDRLEELIISGFSTGFRRDTDLDIRAFQNLNCLKIFHLSSFRIIKPITKDLLRGFGTLVEMAMAVTKIKHIEQYAFENANNLELLDLSDNFIEKLENNTFYGLYNLKVLNLKGNLIAFFNSTSPFQYLHNLRSLNLVGNRLVHLPANIFVGLYSVLSIRIDNNLVIPWLEPLLLDLKNMSIFTLSSNSLSHFTQEMLDDVKNLDFLDFSQNPLNCSDCKTINLQAWLQNTTTHIERLNSSEPKSYSCHNSLHFKDQFILTVDLSLNHHCFPVKLNILLITLSITCFILCIVACALFIWYKWRWSIRYLCFHIKTHTKKYREQTLSNNYEYDAFVSYCEEDFDWVKSNLLSELEVKEPKFKLCFPDRDFVAGHSLTESILSAIRKCRTTILVLSNTAMKSHWCKFDMDMAQHQLFGETRSGLILILLESIQRSLMTENLKYVLRTRTALYFPNHSTGQKLFWERLKLAISQPSEKTISKHIT